ncbi:MAG: UDP-N-acetylmuramoyl-L-alanyl-D-glutamate--2,6-diaminopimelate ligase [Legionella sp.]|nr:UDP-N-acetylmuramoyl-L-alanyl-D-glutamate--2,6-diaminopimelate ligase [Legionella sp.]
MKLASILTPWADSIDFHDTDIEILGIQNDSRLVTAGDLFIAYPGAKADGRLFLDSAVAAGAVAILYEAEDIPVPVKPNFSIPCLAVPHLVEKLPEIASRFYQQPSQTLHVIGVTGTNGKTTIAFQLAQALELLGEHAAYIGTIGQGRVNQLHPLDNTTPDALQLQKLLASYRDSGIKYVCMEVSSHALALHRVDAIQFTQAIFTNLTLDHLDFHQTMAHYAQAKAKLFSYGSLQQAIINIDDPYAAQMTQALNAQVELITYGMQNPCKLNVKHWQMDIRGTQITIDSGWGEFQVHMNALGVFNIYNTLALFGCLVSAGFTPENVIRAIADLKPAPGRLEIVAQKPCVLVDYAHTPDALENALQTLKQLPHQHLWVIFGCGGNRDRSKRPLMGKIASNYADFVVITSDNPRHEEPESIIADIAQGISTDHQVKIIIKREEAIAFALKQAQPDDIILIAGKGHEDYQQIGDVKYPFSDQEVVQRLNAD